ncbi:hypothetical protein SAMN05192529_101167 [Arachidicoccus rhizosphaerae]|uniref:Uncharacterized protein n=1 Tax=Arachidicoccus rhizosphaerae TaxID=551991 RepID=A0A1H3VIC9_9BACT|nr:hypothetical protein SAMN05192529_101167 [Arachidicoccus rhizosphaerae]
MPLVACVMNMKRPERLPSRLLKAVFQPPDNILDNEQWDEQAFLLKEEFLRFSRRKQLLILRFYAEKISIIALAEAFNISAKACPRELNCYFPAIEGAYYLRTLLTKSRQLDPQDLIKMGMATRLAASAISCVGNRCF